jgi:hypothetical protein
MVGALTHTLGEEDEAMGEVTQNLTNGSQLST